MAGGKPLLQLRLLRFLQHGASHILPSARWKWAMPASIPRTAVSDAPFVCVDTPRSLILLSLLILTHGYNGCVPAALSQAEEHILPVFSPPSPRPAWPLTLSLTLEKLLDLCLIFFFCKMII